MLLRGSEVCLAHHRCSTDMEVHQMCKCLTSARGTEGGLQLEVLRGARKPG